MGVKSQAFKLHPWNVCEQLWDISHRHQQSGEGGTLSFNNWNISYLSASFTDSGGSIRSGEVCEFPWRLLEMEEQVNPLERDHYLYVVLPGGLEKNATVHGR